MTTRYAKHLLWCVLFSLASTFGQAQESSVQIYGEVFFYGNIISDELNECVQLYPLNDPSPSAAEIVEMIYADIAHAYEYAFKTGTGGNQDEISWYIRRDVDQRYGEKLIVQVSGPEGWLCHLVYDYLNHYASQGCIQWNYLYEVGQEPSNPASDRYSPLTIPSGYGSPDLLARGTPATTSASQAIDQELLLPRHLKNNSNKPTSEFKLPAEPFQKVRNIDKVYSLISTALKQCEYEETAYFEYAGGGFEIIVPLEEMTPDGLKARSVADYKYKSYHTSIHDYLQLLQNEPTGYYRFFVFKYDPQDNVVYETDIGSRSPGGIATFTDFIPKSRQTLQSVQVEASPPVTSDINLMVYEFERPPYQKGVLFKRQGLLSAEEHLQQTGLWAALNRAFRN